MTASPDPMARPARRALAAALNEAWAITAEGLETVLAIAAREHEVTPEALEAYKAQFMQLSENMGRRGNVAILNVRGPLFRYANIFTAISGATSYDALRRDLQVALDDKTISAIVLDIDSPGGTVTGVDELAKAIFEARSRKHITAYIGGTGASAAYWLASQASEIVVSDAAIVGSIGVRAVLQDTSEADKKAGKLEFISSQSPGKRAALDTDEGKARVQRMVDSLADVFVAAVARGRGASAKTVLERYGAGDVIVGAAAVKAGLADRLGSFEAVIATLAKGETPRPQSRRRQMDLSSDALAERERIRAIITSEAAKGRETTAMHLAFSTLMDAQSAIGLLATLPQAAPAAPAVDPLAGVLRAQDAPGGLVTVQVRPDQARPQAPADADSAMWQRTIGALNAKAGAA
jgi:capsid assembly protease